MKHLKEVNETYFVHMQHSLSFCWMGLKASLACLVHAFIPCVFEKTASTTFIQLVNKIAESRKYTSDNEHI